MGSTLDRLILAAGLSIAGILGTLTWYQVTATKISRGNAVAIAQAAKVRGEVSRRTAARLLWQSVVTGKQLYEGETIRTSENSQLRLEFFDGRFIDIDPNSLIILQKPNDEINIDIMDGNIFVGSENIQEPAIRFVLKAGAGKVDLTKASAAVAKTGPGTLDVSVWAGKAMVKNADGTAASISAGNSAGVDSTGLMKGSKNLKFLSPLPGKKVVLDAGSGGAVKVQFMGAAVGTKISLMAGRDQKNLKTVATTQKADDVEILARLPAGRFWWKLVATDAAGKIAQESPLSLIEISRVGSSPITKVEEEEPPVVVAPPPPPAPAPVAVKAPAPVAVKAPLPVPVEKRTLSSAETSESTMDETPLLDAPEFEAGPDVLVSGLDGRLALKWSAITKAKKYRLVLMKGDQKIAQRDVTTTSESFSNLLPGDYSVTVVAIDTFGRSGGESEPRKLKVPDLSDIQSSKLKKVLVK